MKYLSLFSGIGGFELGIQQAYGNIRDNETSETGQQNIPNEGNSPVFVGGDGDGRRESPTCIGYSEIDKYAIKTYQSHFNHKNYGDITKIKEEELPEFDLLVGGFPCQSFSIAGKRGGFNDTRGTLFFDIARILKAKQPRLLLLENVKGLLSHDEGRTFATIISTLDELGYDLQWQVLNSKNFGVPQNRERVFIVGHLRGTSRPEVFPFRYDEELPSSADNTEKPQSQTKPFSTIIAFAERGRYNADGKIEQQLEPRFDGVTNTLTSVEKDNRIFDGLKIRRLTPKECERLQGFPDNWTLGSDTQRYKQCGNAVTVNVIKEIVGRLLTSTRVVEQL